MHAEAECKNGAEDRREFREQIQRQVDQGNFDFSFYIFPEPIFFLSAMAWDADPRDWYKSVKMSRPLVEPVTFTNARFSDEVVFSGLTFKHTFDFSEVVANGRVTFWDVLFDHPSGQRKEHETVCPVQLRGEPGKCKCASFYKTDFVKGAHFHSTFLGTPDFQFAKFRPDAERTIFEGLTDSVRDNNGLDHSHLGKPGKLDADLRNVTFENVDLSECTFEKSGRLHEAEFYALTGPYGGWARLSLVSTWPRQSPIAKWANHTPVSRWGRIAIADEVFQRTGGETRADERATFRRIERLYRELRMSYEACQDSPRMGVFYFAEMEMRRLTHTGLGRTVGSLTGWYGLVSGYGERWANAFGWFLGVWLICAILYVNVGLFVKVTEPDAVHVSQTILRPADFMPDALIHSFLVATLIGRDIYAVPATWAGQLVQTAELILGPLLFGLMGLGIRRRFQR